MSIQLPAAGAEVGRARLLELLPEGFEERDEGPEVEFVAYVDADREPLLRAAFPRIESTPVEPGWEDRWRAFHRGVRVGDVWIGPPWERPPAGATAIVVDPGRAFGTGAHPTTRMCVQLLAGHERGSLLDAGCGSGVLAVAAARLGFAPVHAVDSDEAAVAVARETACANHVAVEAERRDVLADRLPDVDLVVANIDRRTVELLLARNPAPRGIASGYLATERPVVPGWRSVDHVELEGWAADLLEQQN